MTLNKLASLIAKREGKKHQASIGDIREILKIITELEIAAETSDQSPLRTLYAFAAVKVVKSYVKGTRTMRIIGLKRTARKSK